MNTPSWLGAMVMGAAPEQQILERHPGLAGQGGGALVEGADAGDLVDGADLQVILEVLTHARQVALHRDAVAVQHLTRPDAGQLQQVR